MQVMKRLTVFVFALATATPVLADITAVVNVNVLPMTSETVIPGQTVVVDDGVITAIGDVEKLSVPEGTTIIDGTDRYLMPGLVEMHGHITSTDERDIERLFSLFLANGVTTVRGMLGRPSHLELREDIRAGRIPGPRLITSGPSLNGNSVSGPADAERQVREQHAAGYDFLKIHPGLDAEEFDAIADAANELGMPFAGHVPVSVGLAGALDKGMATIDHLDGYMAALLPANTDTSGGYGGFFDVMLADQIVEQRIDEIVHATVAAGVANVPTESLFEHLVSAVPADELGSRPEMRYMPPDMVQNWIRSKEQGIGERGFSADVAREAIRVRRKLILALHESGALLLLGSDAPQVFNVPGFSLHHELGMLVEAGLTPFEALRSGTIAPARFFALNTGTVEIGLRGELVLLDANPLTDINNSRRIHGVIVGGKWASSAELLAQVN